MTECGAGLHLSDFSLLLPITGTELAFAINTCHGTSMVIAADTAKHLIAADLEALPRHIVATLVEFDILTSDTSSQEEETYLRVLHEQGRAALSATPLAYLMPSYDCNLKCVYCFQHKIRQAEPSVRMSEETVRAAFSYLDHVFRDDASRGITLYGGEPLTVENRPIVEFICAEAKRYDFALMAATHGWNLDHYADLIGAGNISALHVTADGPAATHNRLRVGPRGAATFDTIMSNIEMALARGVRVRMRINVNEKVLDLLEEFRSYLETRGMLGDPRFSAYVAPMFATKAQVDSRGTKATETLVTEAVLANKLAANPDLARAFGGYPPVYDRISALIAGHSLGTGAGHCCFGSRTIVLDPEGGVYPCVFLAGERKYAVGSYFGSTDRCSDGVADWVDEGTRRCAVKKCKYALYCGAGSPYDSFARAGTASPPSCTCSEFAETFAGYARAAYWRATAW